jgi:uncharacterized protein (DUF2267 family)
MQYAQFLVKVEREARVPRDDAERVATATLTTLGERLSKGEARDVAEQLPAEIRAALVTDTAAEVFFLEEFLRRVAEREGVVEATAELHARGVFAALGWVVDKEELSDMAAELPNDFGPLLEATMDAYARRSTPPPLFVDEFADRVARRAGLKPIEALAASAAGREARGQRLSHGEVEDVAPRIPEELRPSLWRGDADSSGVARPLGLADFLRLTAEIEGVTPDQAKEHARAVFATLREVVGEDEFADIEAQLPDEYTVVLARP